MFAKQCGVARVTVIEPGAAMAFPDVIGPNGLDAAYGETVSSIDADGDVIVVTTERRKYRSRAVLVAERPARTDWVPSIDVAESERVLVDRLPDHPSDDDVLVVGHTDHAVELAATLTDKGSGVVIAAGGMDPSRLSPVAVDLLNKLERERQATLLYRSSPTRISDVHGYPMADFGDRRTPDLQFDYVVFASGRRTITPAEVGLSDAAVATGRVWLLGEPSESTTSEGTGGPRQVPTAPGWRVGRELLTAAFPELDVPEPARPERRRGFPEVIEELRAEHYNATITHFEPTHSDLWVLRVKPDHGSVSHLPGQYASLGLGYWEERIDDAVDPDLDAKFDKLIRRSYSISSRMFDEHGYLAGEWGVEELEFYIVLVPPTPDNVPGLTPRLALMKPGDRIYLGPKVAGRYTLAPVTDPHNTVLFFSTGTGEAPHNAMVTELLRKGHQGPILSAVSVRQWADLGYIDKHRELESRYPNYRYVPLPTREADVPKRYIQDLVAGDVFDLEYGIKLDPSNTHVFMCGNPAMIGLPVENDAADSDTVTYPEVTGVVELLAKRGFTLDHRNERGNVHYEEYW